MPRLFPTKLPPFRHRSSPSTSSQVPTMGGGGDVRGKPLKIPWDQMSLGIPPAELYICRSSSIARGSTAGSQQQEPEEVEERRPIEDDSDHDVQEISCRNKFDTSSMSGLPDKGVKFPACIRVHEQVRNRREKSAKEYEDEDGEVPVTRSQSGVLSGLHNHQAPPSIDRLHASPQCTFSSLLNQKLDTEVNNNSSAFTMELGFFSGKTKRFEQADPQKHKTGCQAKSPCGSLSLRFRGSITRSNKQRSSAGCDTKHSTFLSSIFRRRKKSVTSHDQMSNNPPTETCLFTDSKGFQDHTSTSMDSNEVEEVVVLDEEDSEDELQLIQPREADFDNQKEAIIYYPSRDHPECVEICYSDITCLNARTFLSSTIMNFYIQYLRKSSSLMGVQRGEYHFLNTYFYTKLEEAVSTNVDKNVSFAKLRRWLKGVNIFEKAYIFLPIHGNLHWSLVIICTPAKEDESGPIILHLDSLGAHDSNLIFQNVERYLKEEWRQIGEDTSPNFLFSEKTWRNLPHRIRKKTITVPQQKNIYDCGLFVLYFMERFIEDAPERIRLKDVDKFGRKWFRSEEASALRTRLRELLVEELESARLEGIAGSPTSSASCLQRDEISQSESNSAEITSYNESSGSLQHPVMNESSSGFLRNIQDEILMVDD